MRIKPPNDPVLKGRVRVTGNFQSTLIRVITIGVIVVFLAAMGYIFSDKIQPIFLNNFQTADNSPSVISEKTPSLTTTSKAEGVTLPLNSAPTTEIPAIPSNITESAATVQPKSDTTLSQAKATPSVSSKPVVLSVESVTTKAVEPAIGLSFIPSAKPVTTSAQSGSTQSTAVQPSVAPEGSTQSSKMVQQLLAKAHTQINKMRFTSPQGDNAYETYQILLKKAPQSAQEILNTIVAWYFKQGEKYIDEGKLTQPEERGNAYKMYQQLREIAPQHLSTQTLFSNIFNILNQQAAQQIQKDRLIAPRGNNAYATYQEMLIVAPDSQDTQQLFKTIVERLLARARQQMEKRHYTTPRNSNAASTYKQILKLDSENVEAQQGIDKIVQKYYRLAVMRRGQHRYKGSMIWIRRGLQLAPGHPELNQLKQEVREKMSQLGIR